MAESSGRRIRQITACVKGNYVNVYGLDERDRVWTWDPVKAAWQPYKITPRPRSSRSGDRRDGRDNPRDDWR